MFAEIVVNIEVPLDGTFHYNVPADLREKLQIGHLVEVEFGRRLAQGIILAFSKTAPIPDTKPIIALIDPLPVVQVWQLDLAKWLSEAYQTALNQCVRLMLPPGITRWSDVVVDINPSWGGAGRLTDVQDEIVRLLRENGDMRGRKLNRMLPKTWRRRGKAAIQQLVKRKVLRRGTVLDPPRIRPKKISTAELVTDPEKIRDEVVQLGRANRAADVLNFLATSDDPLPAETTVLKATGATKKHLAKLADENLIERIPKKVFDVEKPDGETVQLVEAATVGLAIRPRQTLGHILRLRKAEKYHAILTLLAEAAQPIAFSEIYEKTGATRTYLNKLEALQLIRFRSDHVWRNSLADRDFVPSSAPPLTADQARVWDAVRQLMNGEYLSPMLDEVDFSAENITGKLFSQSLSAFLAQSPTTIQESSTLYDAVNSARSVQAAKGGAAILLYGVTGSGKTEIYMRAIDLALERGQQAIVLVPEIALTPQTTRRFAARFPGRVAVMHSGLSEGERYDTWRRARLGLFDIVIGARSAMFTPLKNIGVVVVDEEHDASYKQTPPVPPPYYHAREAAMALGRVAGAIVILGSATPDVVSYYRAQQGILHLLELPKRVMGHRKRIEEQMARLGRTATWETAGDESLMIGMPPVTIVDLRQELRAGNRSIFSRMLQKEMDAVLAREEQAILFLNRRGSSTYVFCRDCGHVHICPNCDTPLTYHQSRYHLTCHRCGHHVPPPESCPACQSRRIKYFGLGTEQLEQLVMQRWPTARVTRWDGDTTAEKDSHDELLAQFVNHEADILIGTQMIAKGLDLPLVTLVGVISADTALNLPDFRTGERAFQLLTQVAGRAGRSLLGGRVILQTYHPEHYAIQAAQKHDYGQFFLDEINARTKLRYPPFRRLVKLTIADPIAERAAKQAKALGTKLRQHIRDEKMGGTEIIGPVPPFFSRIDRRYRWQIIIRTTDPTLLLEDFHVPPPWVIDIDPVSTL